jgi:S-formylglutathione hydrolase FrmB
LKHHLSHCLQTLNGLIGFDSMHCGVVAYIDAHYRTIPKRTSRGLAGHSMCGYGASRIGMKHSDVFGSLYIMSPCCMSARGSGGGRGGPGAAGSPQ